MTSNSDTGANQQHHKANYIEVLQRITPEFYADNEYRLFGEEEDLQYRVLARILSTASNTSSLIDAPVTTEASAFSSNLSFVPYYVPFNGLTHCSPSVFEKHVLSPLGKQFGSFRNVSEFSSFVVTSALPNTHMNGVTDEFADRYKNIVNPQVSSVGLVQDELLARLGWAYMLNTSGLISDADSIAPSSVLVSSLNEKLFYGTNLTTETGVSDLFKWMGLNVQGGGQEWDSVGSTYLPAPFSSPSSTLSDNYWASGGQLVSAMDTMVKVWVNEDDPNSLYFRDIVNASLLGLNVSRMENAGPMGKMLKALAYGFYDVKNTVRDIQFLLDIEECPEEFLQYLGRYLGWTFFGDDPAQWRDQLQQAIYLYKAKGTRQALANAVNMLIPSSIYNPNDKTAGLQELYESYFPNLLYYTIKTASPVGKSPQLYKDTVKAWRTSLNASGINNIITNSRFDPNNQDNNVRYLVDYILHYLDYKFDFLQYNSSGGGVTNTPVWQGQLSANEVPHKIGFQYRGYTLALPPWEEQRFYQNADLTLPLIRATSAILARPIGNLGLGVDTSAAEAFGRYISSSVNGDSMTADGMDEPGWGYNLGFKFLTSGLNLPFNYQSIIAEGDLESMSVFDYWNSKASEVHSKFYISSIDGTWDDYLNISKTKLGRKGLTAITDIFRQFAPFHVINRMFVGSGINENYFGYHNTDNQSAPSTAWSGTYDIEIINTIQDNADQWNSSYAFDAFPGTMGTGYFSSVGMTPSLYFPRQGRWVPSGSVGGPNMFWSGGTVYAPSALKKNREAYRTAGRRRNFKYDFVGWAQTRRGLNEPIATDFFSGFNPERGLNISGFVPRGFNFSAQEYVSTTGDYSSVYSQYNTSATPFFQYSGLSFFPQRNVPNTVTSPSSWNQMRDIFGSQVLRSMTQIFLRRAEEDRRWLTFSDEAFNNFKFGEGVMTLYQEYNRVFRRQLRMAVDQAPLVKQNLYAGGYNIISHAFGPILFNNDLSIKGRLTNHLSALAFDTMATSPISSVNGDWSAVATTQPNQINNIIFNTQGERKDLSQGILQGGGYNTFVNPLDTFEDPSRIVYSNDSLLSGVQIVAPPINAMAIWNSPDNLSYNVDQRGANGLTLIQRNVTDNPLESLRVRFPLDANINYSYNGYFKFQALDAAASNMSLSAAAGWQLCDYVRTPQISQFLGPAQSQYGPAKSARLQEIGSSATPTIQLIGRGRGAQPGGVGTMPLGQKNNPMLRTVVEVQDKKTPANLRALEPDTIYEIVVQASSSFAAGTPYIAYGLFNLTKKKRWDGAATTWVDTASDLSANGANLLASSVDDTAVNGFVPYRSSFTTSSGFEKGDNYQFYLTPINNGNLNYHAIEVSSVTTSYVGPTQTGNDFNGHNPNKLFPNEDYTLNISARVAQLVEGLPGAPETICARLVVEQKPFVGNGWEDFSRAWAYNWDHKFWEELSPSRRGQQWKPMTLSSLEQLQSTDFPIDVAAGQTFSFPVNTHNHRTPARYFSTAGPLNGYFTSAGLVHDEESVYYLEIAKPAYTGDFNGVTLMDVNLVNNRYNNYVDGYEKNDFRDVFDYFDDLNNNKQSRQANNSSSTYLVSGGSRSEYLEYWGGSYSSTNGTYGFVDNQRGNPS